jgi:hypothetical protein
MATLQTVIELGRMVRERNNISLKTPVKEVIVVSKDQGTFSLPPSLPPSLVVCKGKAVTYPLLPPSLPPSLPSLRQARSPRRERAGLRAARAECLVSHY